ncbi:hypothetical protein BTVI_38059 [Pitangus sulphuratus]|nr:hypothetical protein BTVI_38059 [Pitangus sulphuratus]
MAELEGLVSSGAGTPVAGTATTPPPTVLMSEPLVPVAAACRPQSGPSAGGHPYTVTSRAHGFIIMARLRERRFEKDSIHACCKHNDPACVLKRSSSLIDSVSPGLLIGDQSRPMVMINMAKAERLFQAVLVSPLRDSSLAATSGKFPIEHNLREAVVLHPGDVPYPMQLCSQQHGLNTHDCCLFKNRRIGHIIHPVDV